MNCKGCTATFTPAKSFHRYCADCSKKLTRCAACNRLVYPSDGKYSCCGITETVEHVKEANEPSRMRGRSLDDMLFILEHNMTPEEYFRLYSPVEDGEDE